MTFWLGMAYTGDEMDRLDQRPRPAPELLSDLRRGKTTLRESRRSLALREKVRAVLILQRVHGPLRARQRRLQSWERPWDVVA